MEKHTQVKAPKKHRAWDSNTAAGRKMQMRTEDEQVEEDIGQRAGDIKPPGCHFILRAPSSTDGMK